jgi:hypothetical protein
MVAGWGLCLENEARVEFEATTKLIVEVGKVLQREEEEERYQ